MKPQIVHQHPQYQLKNPPLLTKLLQKALDFIVKEDDPFNHCTLNFCFVDKPTITELNESFVHHEGATDVITFDYRDDLMLEEFDCDEEEEPEAIGEIYVCLDIAAEYAKLYGNEFNREALLYMIHGILHLHGEDDLTEAERVSMRAAEQRTMDHVLNNINLEPIFTQNENH